MDNSSVFEQRNWDIAKIVRKVDGTGSLLLAFQQAQGWFKLKRKCKFTVLWITEDFCWKSGHVKPFSTPNDLHRSLIIGYKWLYPTMLDWRNSSTLPTTYVKERIFLSTWNLRGLCIDWTSCFVFLALSNQLKTDSSQRAASSYTEPKQTWNYVSVRKNACMFWWLYYTTAAEGYTARPLVIWLQVC